MALDFSPLSGARRGGFARFIVQFDGGTTYLSRNSGRMRIETVDGGQACCDSQEVRCGC